MVLWKLFFPGGCISQRQINIYLQLTSEMIHQTILGNPSASHPEGLDLKVTEKSGYIILTILSASWLGKVHHLLHCVSGSKLLEVCSVPLHYDEVLKVSLSSCWGLFGTHPKKYICYAKCSALSVLQNTVIRVSQYTSEIPFFLKKKTNFFPVIIFEPLWTNFSMHCLLTSQWTASPEIM